MLQSAFNADAYPSFHKRQELANQLNQGYARAMGSEIHVGDVTVMWFFGILLIFVV